MSMNEKITELAYIRNKLIEKSFNEGDKRLLDRIKDIISTTDSPFKKIALNAIENCEHHIRNNEWELGANEIQLIHNFTFKDMASWNSEYFYKVELLSYLEQTEDVDKIKRLISLFANIINT